MPFRTYSIEQGLSESVAHDLLQDRHGFIWVATGYGLNRFDGHDFTTFYERDGLSNNQVNTLFEDRTGTLWVGTVEGVSLVDSDSLYTPDILKNLDPYSVTDFFEDSRGEIWIATDGSGAWVLTENNELIQYTKTNGLSNNHVRRIIESKDGTLWFATRNGVTTLREGNFDRFRLQDQMPADRIRTMDMSDNGNIWFGTREGLAIYNGSSLEVYNHEHGLWSNRIQSIRLISDTTAWVGTEEGAAFFDGSKFEMYALQQGAPGTVVYSILRDREENIWFGTLGSGIKLYLGETFRNYTVENGLSNNIVTGFAEDDGNNIWMATYGGGIIKKEKDQFTTLNSADGLTDEKVYSLFFDADKSLWIGTRNGINLMKNDRFVDLPDTLETIRMVRDFYQDPDTGELWIATYNDGLFIYDGISVQNLTEDDGLASNTVMKIIRTEDGNFWFATYGGVSVYDGMNFRNYTVLDGLPNNGVIHIMNDHKGELWFSTFNGIAKFNDGNIISLSRYSTESQTIAYFIFQDHDDNYWVGTNKGLYNLNPEKYLVSESLGEALTSVIIYTKDQGLVSNEMNAGGSLLASDGTVWLGTVEGATHFFPDKAKFQNHPPVIHLDQIIVGGKPAEKDQFAYDYNRNFVEFNFTGLSYDGPDQISYEYRLRGLSNQWQIAGGRNVRFASLPPGDYRFEVRAYNHFGIPSEKAASYSFQILPPFWMSWWFIILIFLFITGIIVMIYQFWKTKKLVEIERMRVQIASDLHDDVGSSLTELALQTDFLQTGKVSDTVIETLQQIGDHSRKIVSSLDDIVWSIDARNDTIGDLTDRMQDYANNVLGRKGIEVRYNFEELNMDKKLPVHVKENIYLIFKEAVNNISKHSNADKADVELKLKNDELKLCVDDNGSDISDHRKSGQGLRNMKLRAERIGATTRFKNSDGFSVIVTGTL